MVENINDDIDAELEDSSLIEEDFFSATDTSKKSSSGVPNTIPGGDIPSSVTPENTSKNFTGEGTIPSGEGTVPYLRGEGFPDEYVGMANFIKEQYKRLPYLNYDEIYKELGDLSIKSRPAGSLQLLYDEIQRVQSAKDRLSEIFIDVLKNYTFKKRAVDILVDSWGKFALEKSQDKRKGDGVFRLSNFVVDFAATESLLRASTHILKNLDSLHESLSRRITIYQLLMKIGDRDIMSRGVLSDLVLKGDVSSIEDILSGKNNDIMMDKNNEEGKDVDPNEQFDAEIGEF